MALPPERRAELAELVRARGYERREEPFRLSSGGTSHDYVDVRQAVAEGAALRAVGQALIEAVEVEWDVVGGPTMGADPLAHAAALLRGDAAWCSVRKEPKGYGRGQWVEGHRLGPGDRVLAVEDTVSTGGSLLRAIERMTGTGATVVAAATVVDRSPAVAERFATAGIPWVPLLTWADLGIEPLAG
ncbi:MAG TPA: phosphoribosyltransferase family protein [Acidimicrobiales bacterium]|nr:phosphoribosyltransferase family protein [Acidimicrobiales bacterium]